MNVRELIAKPQEFDPELPACVYNDGWSDDIEVQSVEVEDGQHVREDKDGKDRRTTSGYVRIG
jgi:hypothetical protein